jgi:hypothetical protein
VKGFDVLVYVAAKRGGQLLCFILKYGDDVAWLWRNSYPEVLDLFAAAQSNFQILTGGAVVAHRCFFFSTLLDSPLLHTSMYVMLCMCVYVSRRSRQLTGHQRSGAGVGVVGMNSSAKSEGWKAIRGKKQTGFTLFLDVWLPLPQPELGKAI